MDFCDRFADMEMERRLFELKLQLIEEGEDYYSRDDLERIKDMIEGLDDVAIEQLILSPKKNPYKCRLLSFLFGLLGVDAFYVGKRRRGLFKLFTLGGLGILYIYDIFTCVKRVQRQNFEHFLDTYNTI